MPSQTPTAHLRFEGNREVSSVELEHAIRADVDPGDLLEVAHKSEPAVLLAMSLQAAYEARGFADMRVEEVRGLVHEAAPTVLFRIASEGPQYRVKSVRVVELDERRQPRPPTVPLTVSVRPGDVYPGGGIRGLGVSREVDWIVRSYGDLGYAGAALAGRADEHTVFDRKSHTVDLVFEFERGPRYLFDAVTFEGNRTMSSDELRAWIRIAAGDFFSAANVDRATQLLHQRYRFSRVNARTRVAGPGRLSLTFELEEE
jgi:outer membrane protein assembly factor BamA